MDTFASAANVSRASSRVNAARAELEGKLARKQSECDSRRAVREDQLMRSMIELEKREHEAGRGWHGLAAQAEALEVCVRERVLSSEHQALSRVVAALRDSAAGKDALEEAMYLARAAASGAALAALETDLKEMAAGREAESAKKDKQAYTRPQVSSTTIP